MVAGNDVQETVAGYNGRENKRIMMKNFFARRVFVLVFVFMQISSLFLSADSISYRGIVRRF